MLLASFACAIAFCRSCSNQNGLAHIAHCPSEVVSFLYVQLPHTHFTTGIV
jgi:hypothetical protein